MIWLRHELWEYPDGLGYRLASKAETDRLTAAHPDAHLKQVFYAPSAAAAEAQYCALRGMGPYIVNSSDSEAPFTMVQLESQLADFPDDHRLARQPALPVPEGGHPPIPHVDHPEPLVAAHAEPHAGADHHAPADPHHDEAHGQGAAEGHADAAHDDDHHEAQDHGAAEAHGEAAHDGSHSHATSSEPHAEPAHGHEPEPSHQPAPAAPVADAAPEPISDDKPAPVLSDGLGPLSSVASTTPSWAARRRKRNPFLGFLKLIWLLIVIAAVIVGVGIVTGYLDGPTLLAQARELPAVIRDHSIVRTLLPDLAR